MKSGRNVANVASSPRLAAVDKREARVICKHINTSHTVHTYISLDSCVILDDDINDHYTMVQTSKLPLRPSSAGTKMNISDISMKSGQC